MAAKKKTERDETEAKSALTLRDDAEKRLAQSPKISPEIKGQNTEDIIHELKVHQVELEIQAEELQRAHLALEESRDKYLDLFDFAPVGYLTLTDKGLVTGVNLTGAALLDIERSKLVNHGLGGFIADGDIEEWDRYFGNMLRLAEKLTCHLIVMKRKDGTEFPAHLEGIRIKDSSGATTIRIAFNDITDITQAEDALRESEEKYRTLVDTLNEGIWVTDTEAVTTFVNPKMAEILGYTVEEMSGRNLFSFMDDKGRQICERNIERRRVGIKEHYDFEFLKKDGTRIYTTLEATPLNGKNGEYLGVIAGVADITERKRAEDALRQANKKLNLLSGITRHDIKNQMTVLRGFITLLEREQPDPSLKEYFQKLTTTTERISSMIRFTKTYENIGVNAPAWQDCRNIISSAIKEAPHGKVNVINNLPAGIEVYADPLIIKVFYNLIDNAVQYGEKITTIGFSGEEREGNYHIICKDDGIGIPSVEKEKIFERGFGQNTGLGLFLSREILAITGITIRETGEPGKGARFEITVPDGAWRTGGMKE
jgi:PAS domain S-box-containing protein